MTQCQCVPWSKEQQLEKAALERRAKLEMLEFAKIVDPTHVQCTWCRVTVKLEKPYYMTRFVSHQVSFGHQETLRALGRLDLIVEKRPKPARAVKKPRLRRLPTKKKAPPVLQTHPGPSEVVVESPPDPGHDSQHEPGAFVPKPPDDNVDDDSFPEMVRTRRLPLPPGWHLPAPPPLRWHQPVEMMFGGYHGSTEPKQNLEIYAAHPGQKDYFLQPGAAARYPGLFRPPFGAL